MSKEFRADIHCHTNCSDGTDSPMELLHNAKKADLQGLSITDHDTIDAYTPELFMEASLLGIELMPGVEFSSELDNSSVHILGYGFDLAHEPLKQFIKRMIEKRTERNRAILKKLASHNMPITEEELLLFATLKTVGRPHIAQMMVHKGYVMTVRDAFDLYLKEGASCFASGIRFHPEEVIEQIHEAKGKAVLAHPHFIQNRTFLKTLLSFPFDGIECHYGRLDKAIERPWLKIAAKHGLIATGGSDYHGSIKPHISLGCSWVSETIFNSLRNPK